MTAIFGSRYNQQGRDWTRLSRNRSECEPLALRHCLYGRSRAEKAENPGKTFHVHFTLVLMYKLGKVNFVLYLTSTPHSMHLRKPWEETRHCCGRTRLCFGITRSAASCLMPARKHTHRSLALLLTRAPALCVLRLVPSFFVIVQLPIGA